MHWRLLKNIAVNKNMIIILNGCGSAGKTSIAKELQKLHNKPLLHTGIDHFWKMIPDQYKEFGAKASEGYSFVQGIDEHNNPIITIETGPFADRMDETMPYVVKCLAEHGNDIVVDEVFQRKEIVHHYAKALNNQIVYFIGVMCDLEELERRERARGNRELGLARGQIDDVHRYQNFYDLIIDTTNENAINCAQKIFNFIQTHNNPQGLRNFHKKYMIT